MFAKAVFESRGNQMELLIFILILLSICIFWNYYLKAKLAYAQSLEPMKLLTKIKLSPKKNTEILLSTQPRYSDQDIRLFDHVAKLMFEKQIQKHNLDLAQQIQYEFLNKMPNQATSQIHHHDLEEWSIYWSYHNQSLEYYVSKYGIFYTHVDAEGKEHKQEYKC